MNEKISEIIICEKCGQKNEKGITHCANCGNSLYRDYYKGLWLRNTVVTLGLFFLPFIILFYIVNFEVSANFEKQIKNSLDYSVEVNARIIKSFLDERKKDLLSIARLDGVSLEQVKLRRAFFERFIVEKPWFDLISIANPKGEIIFSTDNIKGNIGSREYFKHSLNNEIYNSSIFYSDILHRNAMVISAPFTNRHNEIIGVVVASISLPNFYNLILDLRIGKTSEIFLVNEEGRFLSPSKLGGDVLKQLGYYENEPNPHIGNGGVLVHRDYRGEKVICAYRKFSEPTWYFVSEMDIKEALAPVNALKRLLLSIFIIFGSFLIFSSFFFSKQVTNLLKNLTATLKSALDEISNKKNTIDKINVELRKRLHDCETLSKRLHISEEYVKGIINSISSGLIAVNKDYKITYCNNFAKNFFKIKNIGDYHTLHQISPIFENDEVKSKIEDVFAKNIPFQIEKKIVVLDENQVILSIAGFPVEETEGVNSATLLINDITTQEQMRAQMADYEKLSALSQLALGAAHEINNPLLGITSYIELLLEEEKDVEKKTRAKEVLDSAYRISQTVRGLLNFARPTPPKFTKISLNKLISETCLFLQHQPLFKKINIEKKLLDTLPQITADINQIRQVLINVLLNAAQAVPDTGTITITTNKVKFEEFVEIYIIDTGVGISPENLKKVFDPFFTTKKGEGTGLGLSISFSYVKNHNGEITIVSEVGKGTEVKILLPIRQKGRITSEVIE